MPDTRDATRRILSCPFTTVRRAVGEFSRFLLFSLVNVLYFAAEYIDAHVHDLNAKAVRFSRKQRVAALRLL